MNKMMKLAVAGLLASAASVPAMAVTFQFDPANTSVSIANNQACFGNCGLKWTANYNTGLFDVALDTPTEVKFGIFSVGKGVGFNHADISATIAFSLPGGSVSTGGDASYFTAFGVLTGGVLTWDNPVQQVRVGNIQYTVNFQNLAGVEIGGKTQSDITITASAVPEPATWLTMIAGFGMVGFALRSNRKTLAAA